MLRITSVGCVPLNPLTDNSTLWSFLKSQTRTTPSTDATARISRSSQHNEDAGFFPASSIYSTRRYRYMQDLYSSVIWIYKWDCLGPPFKKNKKTTSHAGPLQQCNLNLHMGFLGLTVIFSSNTPAGDIWSRLTRSDSVTMSATRNWPPGAWKYEMLHGESGNWWARVSRPCSFRWYIPPIHGKMIDFNIFYKKKLLKTLTQSITHLPGIPSKSQHCTPKIRWPGLARVQHEQWSVEGMWSTKWREGPRTPRWALPRWVVRHSIGVDCCPMEKTLVRISSWISESNWMWMWMYLFLYTCK